MALLVEPTARLVFVTSPEDKGCQEKMALYHGLGVSKERMVALVVCKERLEGEMDVRALADLRNVARVRPLAVGTGRDNRNPHKRSYDPNQVCKWLVNPGLFEREGGDKRQLLEDWYAAADLPYFTPSERGNIVEVGASTRLVARKIEQDKLPEVLKQAWTSVASSAARIDAGKHASLKAEQLFQRLKKQSPDGVLLLWVRSLSNAERGELEGGLSTKDRQTLRTRRDQGKSVDDLFSSLNTNKRNPHHLMTPQLFETVRYVAGRMNFAVIPIGDELFFDEYLAASTKTRATVYQRGGDDNLIGFWSRDAWFGGPERRIRQLFLLWHLFRRLSTWNIPLVQLGLRSGEMEKAAYLGVPTIYIEESVSETGGRMLPVTVGGTFPKSKEPSDDTKQWWADKSALATGPNSPDTLQAQMASSENVMKGLVKDSKGWKFHKDKLDKLTESLEETVGDLGQLGVRHSKMSMKQLNTFLFSATDHSALHGALDGGYPFFFRLLTDNLVGLYGARSAEEVGQVTAWLEGTFEKSKPRSRCPEHLLRGTLSEFEIDLLFNVLSGIQVQFQAYKEKFLPAAHLRY
jgi:hypothetical protein